jgi:hypothetical protein
VIAGLIGGTMPTVFEVLLQTGRRLDALIEGKATSAGTTSTLIDAYLSASNGFKDDQFNGGSLFLKLTTVAIPLVTDFAVSAGTVTFAPAQAVLVASGTGYGLMTKRFPLWLMVSKLNEVLAEIRDYVSEETVLVSAMVSGRETTQAATRKIVEVLAGNSASTEWAWTRLTRWQHSGGVLRIEPDLEDAYTTLKVRYLAAAPAVTLPGDLISESYSVSWLALATAVKCLRWRLSQPGAEAQLVTLLLNQLMSDEARERSKNRLANAVTMRMTVQEWPEC